MNSISTFNEYQEARKQIRLLFNIYWFTSLPALVFLGLSVFSNFQTNISPVIFWLCVLSIIPGAILGIRSMRIWKMIMTADKKCCDYLNSQQSQKVTFWTRDNRLKEIETSVRLSLAS